MFVLLVLAITSPSVQTSQYVLARLSAFLGVSQRVNCTEPMHGPEIASVHRSGTEVARLLSRRYNTSFNAHYVGHKKPYDNPVAVIIRNPFRLVADAYVSHRSGHGNVYQKRIYTHNDHLVKTSVWHTYTRYGVPMAWNNESYTTYLKRLSESDGLLVELFHALFYQYHHHILRAMYCDISEPVTYVCLESFNVDPETVMSIIEEHFPGAHVDTDIDGGKFSAQEEFVITDLIPQLRELDQKHANGFLHRIENFIRCPE